MAPVAIHWVHPAPQARRREAEGMTAKKSAIKPPPEHIEAKNLMHVVNMHSAAHDSLRLLYAVPNGGDRNKIVAAKMKREGVKPGVPDYCLPGARSGFHGLY